VQCSHPGTPQTEPMESIDPGINAVRSRSYLQMSVRCETVETPTLDTITRCGQPGDLKRKSERLINLPSNIGCRGSVGATTKTMDELPRMLQSAGIWGVTRLTKLGNNVEVTLNKPSHHKSQILFESDTYIWNIIQLSKFIELLLLYFLSITPLCLWGSVGDKQNCCGMFTYLHKHASH